MVSGLLLAVITTVQAAPTLTAETNRPSTSTFSHGELVQVTFTVTGCTPQNPINLVLETRNEYGQSIAQPAPVPLSCDGSGKAIYVYPAPANTLGYYEINAQLSEGAKLTAVGTRPAGIITYAIVPDPASRIDYGDRLSRFGLLGGYSTAALVMPYLGVRYMLGGGAWASLEPDYPGQFAEKRTAAAKIGKRYPEIAKEYENPLFQGKLWRTYHIATVTKASLPGWALQTNTAGTSCQTFGELNTQGQVNLPSFTLEQTKAFAQDFSYQTARYYQITWEPEKNWCFGGTAAGLVTIFAKSYKAIHQADPQAVVAGPVLFIEEGSSRQLEALWAAGLAKYIDALAIHPYGPEWPPETHGLPEELRKQLRTAEQAKGHSIPFLGTEHGYKSYEIGNLNKALGDIRTTLIMLGEGAALDIGFHVADFWKGDDPNQTDGYGFYWNLNTKINHGTNKLGPKIIVPAYAAMTYLLDGFTSKGAVTNLSATQLGYKFSKENTIISVIWDYQSTSTYPLAADTKVCDWMGNCSEPKIQRVTVGAAPTYLVKTINSPQLKEITR